jgi:putative PIN family toxin of toxin-antitoxin system
MSPRVFVVDTNVLAAGLITGDARSPVAQILDHMLSGAITYLLSPALLDEYRAVLLRPKLGRLHGLTEPEIDALLPRASVISPRTYVERISGRRPAAE